MQPRFMLGEEAVDLQLLSLCVGKQVSYLYLIFTNE